MRHFLFFSSFALKINTLTLKLIMKIVKFSNALKWFAAMLMLGGAAEASAEILADGFDTSTLDYTSWQGALPDEAFVSDISIPGAHDAATGETFTSSITAFSAQTQALTMAQLREQWGIRGFDLRMCLNKSQLQCCHGIALINKTVKDAMVEACQFLTAHPTEFFIYHVYIQEYKSSQKDEFETRWNEILATQVEGTGKTVRDFVRDYWSGTRVGDIRGKMMIFKRWIADGPDLRCATLWDWAERDGENFVKAKVEWYDNEPLFVQDYANPKNDSEIAVKVAVLKNLLAQTVHGNYRWAGKGYKRWAMNFCSGYSGTSSTKSNYGKVASNTNKAVYEYLQENAGPTGIVFADWIGVDKNEGIGSYSVYGKRLPTSIILNNYKYIHDYMAPVRIECRDIRSLGVDRYRNGNIEWADVNNDGHMELLLLGHDDNNGWATSGAVLARKDDGSFTCTPLELPEAEGDGARTWSRRMLVAGDFDSDGNVDLLHGGSWESKMMTGNGQGGFSLWTDSEGNNQFLHYNEWCNDDKASTADKRMQGIMFMADMNMDGYQDILTYNRGYNGSDKNMDQAIPVIIPRVDASLMASVLPEVNDLPALRMGSMAIGDYNHDGMPDVLVTGRNAAGDLQISIALNRGNYRFEVITPESLQPYATYYGAVMMADFNNDGELDLFVSGKGADDRSMVAVLLNQGNDTFVPADLGKETPGVHVSGCDWADIDSDGYVDIVYAGNNDDAWEGSWGSTVLLHNNGDGSFTSVRAAMQGVRSASIVRMFDDNNDGMASIAVMGWADANTGVPHKVDEASFRIYDVWNAPTMERASADRAEANVIPVRLTKTTDSKTQLSWEPLEDFRLYNWILKMKDGRILSAVPFQQPDGTLLTANLGTAATGSSVILDVNPSDVYSYGVQAISSQKKAATPLLLTVQGTMTGVDSVLDERDEPDSPAEYFDLTGRRITDPLPGSIVIERRGTSVRKLRI